MRRIKIYAHIFADNKILLDHPNIKCFVYIERMDLNRGVGWHLIIDVWFDGG